MRPTRNVESRVLAGLSTTTTDGTRVVFVTPTDPPDDGLSGVREPRRPAPVPPSLTTAAPLNSP